MWKLRLKQIQDDMNKNLIEKEVTGNSIKNKYVSSKEFLLNNCLCSQSLFQSLKYIT